MPPYLRLRLAILDCNTEYDNSCLPCAGLATTDALTCLVGQNLTCVPVAEKGSFRKLWREG